MPSCAAPAPFQPYVADKPRPHAAAPLAAEKQLRRKLEAEYGCDLADRKALLRAEINAYLQDEEVGAPAGLQLCSCCWVVMLRSRRWL